MKSEYNFKGYDLDALLRTGQPVRSDVLETILCQNGFHFKNQESSHIKYEHPELKLTITIVKNSTDLAYQRDVARLCLNIRKKAASERAQQLEAALAEAASANKESSKILVSQASLPETVEVVPVAEFEDSVIIRSTIYPQIGVIAGTVVTQLALNFFLSQIEQDIIVFSKALEDAQKNYGFEITKMADGSLELQQPHQKFYVTVPVFGINETYPQEKLQEAIKYSQMLDERFSVAVQRFLDGGVRAGFISSSPGPDGFTNWTVKRKHIVSGEEQTFTLSTAPSYRIGEIRWMALQDAMFQFDFRGNGDSRYFGNMLNRYAGFQCRRQKQEQKQEQSFESKLSCSHPFFPDCTFSIPLPSDIPRRTELFLKYMKSEDQDEKLKMFNLFSEATGWYDEIHSIVSQAIQIWAAQVTETITRFNALASRMQHIKELQTQFVDDQSTRPGQEFYIKYTHPSLQKPLSVRCIKVMTERSGTKLKVSMTANGSVQLSKDIRYTYITHPADVDALEKAIADIERRGLLAEVKAHGLLTSRPASSDPQRFLQVRKSKASCHFNKK